MVSEWHRGEVKPVKNVSGKWKRYEGPVLELTPEVDKVCNEYIDKLIAMYKDDVGSDMAWKRLGLYRYCSLYKTIKLHPRYINEVKVLMINRMKRKGRVPW